MTTLKTRSVRRRWRLRAEDQSHVWTERASIVFTAFDDRAQGVGEAAPLPGRSEETLEEAEAQLAGLAFDVDPDAEWTAACAALPIALSPSARFCAESAILGYWSARRGLELEAALGATQGPLRLAHLVTRPAIERARHAAAGAAALKLKIGRTGHFAEELELVRAIRSQLALPLRVDANRGLPMDEVEDRLAALAALGVELVEEPVVGTLGLSSSPADLALDESMLSPPTAAELLARPWIKAVVLKPTLLGLTRTLELARLGPSPIISHAYEGRTAYRVLLAIARAHPSPYAHGLGLHPGLELS